MDAETDDKAAAADPAKNKNSIITGVVTVIVIAAAVWWFLGRGVEHSAAAEAEHQYQMTVQSGSPIDVCVHAGIVSAAYLQAHDDAKYREAKEREKADCERAGIKGGL